MTARIQRDFNFLSGIFVENEFYMNIYEVNVQFTVVTKNVQEQNTALQRMKYLFSEILENTLFIDQNEKDAIEKFSQADIKIAILPEEPYDQIMGIMLFSKLNAIVEGRLEITDICITSKLCDGVGYLHSTEEDSGPFKSRGWWNDSNPKLYDTPLRSKSKKIVKLKKTQSNWDDLNLGWEEKKQANVSSEIVFVSFDKLDK